MAANDGRMESYLWQKLPTASETCQEKLVFSKQSRVSVKERGVKGLRIYRGCWKVTLGRKHWKTISRNRWETAVGQDWGRRRQLTGNKRAGKDRCTGMLHEVLPQPVTHSSLGQSGERDRYYTASLWNRDAFQIKPSWHRMPVQQFDSTSDKKHFTFRSSTSIIELKSR